ncbi:LPS assembly protein LptD [Cognatiluteimonas telluris]|uniref:LPS assembly protein LptD n=1 Tax=Cognatiluteimonas telluris TaxID=1104775 RepID=UPI001FAEA86D|nr:LPS assembly protein LptD [Lysobacter telluris]
MRRTFRLLPLPLCIALSLAAHAADRNKPEDWRLCPIQDAVPAFPDAPEPQAPGAPGQVEGAAAPGTEPGADAGTLASMPGTPVPPDAVAPASDASEPAATTPPSAPPAVAVAPQTTTPLDEAAATTAPVADATTGTAAVAPTTPVAVDGTVVPRPKAPQRIEQPTDIAGDELTGTYENPEYHGNVVLRRADQFLGADNLDFHSETGKYVAQGSVRYQDSGMRLVADRAEGDQNTDTHNIQDVRYQLIARRGNGGAEHIEMHGAQGALYGATYSTCPPDERMWELRAQRIDVNTDEGTGVARNAVLHVGSVPVLYVPWFPFPIDNRRRTGLLSPTIGMSSRNGFDYKQPYYLNLAPNYDLTLYPRLMTDRGVQLGAEFRYLTDTGRGVFDAAYLPNDRLTDRGRQDEIDRNINPDNWRDDNRALLHFSGSQDLSDNWQVRTRLNWISDARYLEDFNNNLDGATPFEITSTVGLYGRGRYWNAGLTANHHQLADYTLRESVLPYNKLPRAYFTWEQPFGVFKAGVDAEAVRFQDPVQAGGSRIDFKPFISMPLEGASWFVTPKFAWRYTAYDVDQGKAINGNTSPSRALPIASLDAGMYFDRDMKWGGDSYLQTLEPRLFYLRVPYRYQGDIPLFDTRPMTFSWGQLFRDNRYTGPDRQTDANQVTLAMTSRFLRQADGHEKLAVSLGQIRYLDDSRVVTVLCTSPNRPRNCETPADRGSSAWVADADWNINDRWSVGGSYQWDPKFRRQDLASFRTQYLVGDEGVVNLGYRYRRNLLKQADFSFLYPVSRSWSLIGRYYYSLRRTATVEPKLLEAIAGIQWDSCCMAVRLVERRYIHNRQGELNNALQLEIEFKGLGSAGPDTERRLRRAILGYDREDLYLVSPTDFTDSGDADDNSPDLNP